jgi:tRNA threonylcarbamoyladenosine biosynthesis protein TsaB
VIVLGFDTATPSTTVALLDGTAPDGATERRHDPPPGVRPGHAPLLLAFAHELLREAGLAFVDVDRIAVGLGPGGFTGLRIGVATARALAQAADAEIVGVSTLRALAAAAPAAPGQGVLAVVDARRGEVFVAGYRNGVELLHPQAMKPEALAEQAAHSGAGTHRPWLAVGDGAVRFAELLVQAGVTVPEPPSPVHRVSAITVCRLGTRAEPAPRSAVVPDYLRLPDAEEALRARSEGR